MTMPTQRAAWSTTSKIALGLPPPPSRRRHPYDCHRRPPRDVPIPLNSRYGGAPTFQLGQRLQHLGGSHLAHGHRCLLVTEPPPGAGPATSTTSTDSLPMEESEEKSRAPSAGCASPGGGLIALPCCPSSNGAGRQNSTTLSCKDPGDVTTQRVISTMNFKIRSTPMEKSTRRKIESTRKAADLTLVVGLVRQYAFRQPLSRTFPLMMRETQPSTSLRETLRFLSPVGSSQPEYSYPRWTLSWIGYVSRLENDRVSLEPGQLNQ
jgi:hypothetical protein